MRTKSLWTLAVPLVLVLAGIGRAQNTTDQYGGTLAQPCPGGPAANFYTQKIGNRWFLCTPAGNAFFFRSIYNVSVSGSVDDRGVSHDTVVRAKYGDNSANWAWQTARRMQAYGFNGTAEYSSLYMQPVATSASWPNSRHPVPMPFTFLIWPSYYALRNAGGYAPGPVKELIQPTKAQYFNGYRAHSPDIWDPNFKAWLDGAMRADYWAQAVLTGPNNQYLLGINIDDADWMRGFGAGADFKTVALGASGGGREQEHLAWIILITPPTQSSSSEFGQTYSNTTVYSKQQMMTFLQTRYGTVQALNSAWGSTYTSFGSAGGWGTGTGLLDEDGRHAWVPADFNKLATGTAAFKQDMDDFLFLHAQKYFADVKSVLAARAPGQIGRAHV